MSITVKAGSGYDDRIRALLAGTGVDAIVATSPENIYYLTGLDHWGYFAFTALVVSRTGEPVLITRDMERPTVRAQLPWCRHVTFGDGVGPAEVLAAALPSAGTVALDEASMYFPPVVADRIRALAPGLRWVPGSEALAALRAVKSGTELGHMRAAAALGDHAMAAGLAALRPGRREPEVGAELYRALLAAGSQPPGFPPLLRPVALLDQEHVSWADREVAAGRRYFLELSASVRRYHAPCSRTISIGPPSPQERTAARTAEAGLFAARDALRPGMRTGEVYAAWQRAVAGRRQGPLRHHCGYLVGIGFPPSWVGGAAVPGIRPGGETVVAAGMTFHLMSWVNGPAGHVVSDTALVTETGTELLTTTPHEPIV